MHNTTRADVLEVKKEIASLEATAKQYKVDIGHSFLHHRGSLSSWQHHFSCDSYCYDEFGGQIGVRPAQAWRSRRVRVRSPELRFDPNVFIQFMDQHPVIQATIKDRIQGSQKISDYLALNQWKRTDLWNNFFRLEGLNYQLACLSLDEGRSSDWR
jgi:hypothetical protein